MFVHMEGREVLGIAPEQCVTVMESLNRPNISIPNVGTEPTHAFIVGAQGPSGGFKVFVYMHHLDSGRVSIFASDGPEVAIDGYPALEASAVEWAESMGFMLDNLNFHMLAPPDKTRVGSGLQVFSAAPPPPAAAEPPLVGDAVLEPADAPPAGPSAEELAALGRLLAVF